MSASVLILGNAHFDAYVGSRMRMSSRGISLAIELDLETTDINSRPRIGNLAVKIPRRYLSCLGA